MRQRDTPVRRAQHYYAPPPTERPDAWDLIPPAERVWRWYEQQMQRRVAPPAGMLLGVSIYARINHGRWVADCPCGSAQVVTPDDARFACPECGYGWAQLTFPAQPAAAEAAVADRAPHERNWWHEQDRAAWDRTRQPVPEKDRGQPPEPTEPVPEEPKPEDPPAGTGPKGSPSR
ncbi:hypothetical protein [Streptomyces erythrochromogenes]|uniref:hypothetical protein n=1 Tax=Streptomyces erythrochromogenes TaxID=285574 RepID=UPI0022510BB2|nr:hypothetical protein [Streptomyces erythrochromogenes]MCX5584288.1 hypothetical protein [Streptomyces erythrochromogenes]